MVERPCPRSSGRNRGQLRERTPTTEDNETEIVTPTESLYRGKKRKPGRITTEILAERDHNSLAGQSARAGAASEAVAGGLHQEAILPLAGVTTAEWLSWYNRRYLGERPRVSRALGL